MKIRIDVLETVNSICIVCERYKHIFDIDICSEHYTIEGVSVLGVAAMLGREVDIIVSQDLSRFAGDFERFRNDMIKIGAYETG